MSTDSMLRTLREFSHWLDGVWVTEEKGVYRVHAHDPYGISSAGENLRTIADRLEHEMAREGVRGTTEFEPRGNGEGVCSECNSLMYDGDQFCPNCGKRVAR